MTSLAPAAIALRNGASGAVVTRTSASSVERLAAPSPGKCFAVAATRPAWSARTNVAVSCATTLGSLPNERSPRKPRGPSVSATGARSTSTPARRSADAAPAASLCVRSVPSRPSSPAERYGGAQGRRRIAPPPWSTKTRGGRPISPVTAWSFAVVAENSAGVQRCVRMTPPISPARIRARNVAEGGPASALTIVSPAGAAAAGPARTSAAALPSSQRGSSRTLEAQAGGRIEVVEAAPGDGQLEGGGPPRPGEGGDPPRGGGGGAPGGEPPPRP